ncbi:3-oxo-tetronate kinase [Clostridium sp. Marseille-P2415]|uniref:3-oxo-tetronate kinase n=1 Tax=Clostridium sp. Marseille-P2415 TaxID=1805471 RepID=UPI003FA4D07A
MEKLLLGCVADDFTGASDAASFLVKAGLKTILLNGIPQKKMEDDGSIQAMVIALKSRTEPVKEAVEQSIRAFEWLKQAGAEKFYFKYCSTFDSTRQGNIGPVTDAVMEYFRIPYTLLCPSLPVNGRTVKGGRLLVDGIPLHKSHMKDHPLTPMWDDSIEGLMRQQGKYPCVLAEIPMLEDQKAFSCLKQRMEELAEEKGHAYLIPDYYQDGHGDLIAERFGTLELFTGGSGLAGALGRHLAKRTLTGTSNRHTEKVKGKALLLAGSCSAITLKQIEAYKRTGKPCYRIYPQKLLSGEEGVSRIWEWIREQKETPLIYSSAPPEELRENQKLGEENAAGKIEEALAALAVKAVEEGFARIISAGGETSGAITKALGCSSYLIGESVAPGVPIMTPLERPGLRLVLKSGNFGQEEFFEEALRMTGMI